MVSSSLFIAVQLHEPITLQGIKPKIVKFYSNYDIVQSVSLSWKINERRIVSNQIYQKININNSIAVVRYDSQTFERIPEHRTSQVLIEAITVNQ